MYCRIRKSRVAGVRVPDRDAIPVIEGVLTVAAGSTGLVARVVPPLAMRAIAELYDVRLVSVRDGALVLRGFEPANEQAVLQDWECRPVDTRYGFDSSGHPLSCAPFPE